MMNLLKTAFLIVSFFSAGESFAFMVNPAIRASGQTLQISCDPKTESACMTICNDAATCEIKEPYCRSCAGTQNLKLKRIFDSVGTSLIAVGDPIYPAEFITTLKEITFISLHSLTIYNYSGQYDGEQARAQFKYLCPNLSLFSEKTGILLLEVNSKNNQVNGVLGAICPDEKTGQAAFYSTNSRWQI